MNDPDEQNNKDGTFPDQTFCTPPRGYASGHWPAHTRAFAAKGLGDADRVPSVTVLSGRKERRT
jgi:hypothetical protein